jgi:hypothetical protein
MNTNEWAEGYAESVNELAERVGGQIEVTSGVYTVVHKETGRIVRTSKSIQNLAGWLAGYAQRSEKLQAPPPRRGPKPGSRKSAKKAATKRPKNRASKTPSGE